SIADSLDEVGAPEPPRRPALWDRAAACPVQVCGCVPAGGAARGRRPRTAASPDQKGEEDPGDGEHDHHLDERESGDRTAARGRATEHERLPFQPECDTI